MDEQKWHEIWLDQCAAAQVIRQRYGLRAAFDYLVAEKLLNFADAATLRPEFARELPRFVSRVRDLFTPGQIRAQLAQIEQEKRRTDAEIEEDDEFMAESPAEAAARARQFETIKELLTAATLGTS